MTTQDKIWNHFQGEGQQSFSGAKARLDFLMRRIEAVSASSSTRVLTIGVGDAYLEHALYDRGWCVTILDPDQRAINRLRREGFDAHEGIIERLQFKDASFDVLVASEVLEHLSEVQGEAALREASRVLRGGGYFLGTVPHRENLQEGLTVCPRCGEIFHRWGHQRSFDLKSLETHLLAHFARVSVSRTTFIDWRARDLVGKAKGAVRILLAKLGSAIAQPSIYFVAQK